MRRRDFLALGTATGLLSGALHPARAHRLFQASSAQVHRAPIDPDWVIGYWSGSDELVSPTAAFRAIETAEETPWEVPIANAKSPAPFIPDILDAANLAPDGTLAGKQVRLTLVGMQPQPAVWYDSEIQSFVLHAFSAPHEVYPDLPEFLFWSYHNDRQIKHGAPVRCHIQIESGQDLVFQTDIEPFGNLRQSLVLAMADKANLPKARRGVYVIARRDVNTGKFPDWQDYQFRSSDPQNKGTRKYLYRLEGDRLVMAPFPYFILAIEL